MSNPTPKTKEYSNGEVTVVWKPSLCIHSEKCVHGLPNVFKPKERPWIDTDGASSDALIQQIKQCPSGALSYYMTAEGPKEPTPSNVTQIDILPNGPLIVHGNCTLKQADGTEKEAIGTTALCRCGASQNKPFCDGSHKKIDFKG